MRKFIYFLTTILSILAMLYALLGPRMVGASSATASVAGDLGAIFLAVAFIYSRPPK